MVRPADEALTHRRISAAHRVTFLRDMNFYVRNTAGKHPMSIDELREAFNLSATVAQKSLAVDAL
jgi:hypothetical protein